MLEGRLADFVRRYDALLRMCQLLEQGQFVSVRHISVWLGPDFKRQLEVARKQEKKGLKEKPEAIAKYEIELQRADMMHKVAQKFVSRGKLLRNYPKKLQAHRSEAQRLYRLALHNLEQGVLNEPGLEKWLDKPLNVIASTGIRPEFSEMPRVRVISEVRKLRGIPNNRGKRGNWLHLKRDFVQQEIDKMRPIYLSLQVVLAKIESEKPAYPTKALLKGQLIQEPNSTANNLEDCDAVKALARTKILQRQKDRSLESRNQRGG